MGSKLSVLLVAGTLSLPSSPLALANGSQGICLQIQIVNGRTECVKWDNKPVTLQVYEASKERLEAEQEAANKKVAEEEKNYKDAESRAEAQKNKAKDAKDKQCFDSQGYSIPCRETYGLIENTQRMDNLGQVGGALSTQMQGQRSLNNAMKDGQQSSYYRASASTANLAGTQNVALGAVNLMMSQKLRSKGKLHDLKGQDNNDMSGMEADWARDLRNQAQQKRNLAKMMTAEGSAPARQRLLNEAVALEKQALERQKESRRRSNASGEQNLVAGEARTAAYAQTMQGIQQLGNGLAAMAYARGQNNIAGNLKPQEQGVTTPGFDPFTEGATPNRAPLTISGARAPNNQGAGGEEDPEEEPPTAPPALPGEPDNGILGNGMTPQARVAGDKTPVQAAGGGALGGAATQASQAGADAEPQAQYAENKADAVYGSGGGGGRGRGGDDKGVDLSGLLAQFLPQNQEEKPQGGIMEFGNREPASEAALDGSLLGRDADLFKRVHDTYQDHARRGSFGKI